LIRDPFPIAHMKPKPTDSPKFDASVVAQLACPACFGALRLDASQSAESHLVCAACSRAYPIIDGIPALIIERAEADRAESLDT
jgi:uncharacterized protein YbaR (Trm112 family)